MRSHCYTILIAASLSLLGCDDFIDILAESPCINSEDARTCKAGERAGSLVGTSNSHCCENDVKRTPNALACNLTASQSSKLFGELTSFLEVQAETAIKLDIRAFRYEGFHKFRRGHCPSHAEKCDDEVIGREWRVIGKIEVAEDLSQKIEKLQDALKELNLDPSGLDTNFAAGQRTVLSSRGMLASACEERDHDSCPEIDTNAPDMVPVNSTTEAELIQLIPSILGGGTGPMPGGAGGSGPTPGGAGGAGPTSGGG